MNPPTPPAAAPSTAGAPPTAAGLPADQSKAPPSPPSVRKGYEVVDISVRQVIFFALSIAVSLFVVVIAVGWLYRAYLRQQLRSQLAASSIPVVKTKPRGIPLQTDEVGDLQRFLAQEKAWIEGTGWVDRKAGLVHIPIDRAIALTLTRGLPARPAGTDPAREPTGTGGTSTDFRQSYVREVFEKRAAHPPPAGGSPAPGALPPR